MSVGGAFPFGGSPFQTNGNDFSVNGKQFPGVTLVPASSEAGGVYCAIREISGAIWIMQNADLSGAGGFFQVNLTLPSYAFVLQSNGVAQFFTVPAGSAAGFTWFANAALTAQYTIAQFIASGTFTTAANSSITTKYRYRMLGGGGGGGGANGAQAASGGGGSGGYAEGFFSGIGPNVPIVITVGTGGAGGAATGNTGTSGINSVLGAPLNITAFGGGGGAGSTATTAGVTIAAGGTGGGTGGGPPISVQGANGQGGITQITGAFGPGCGAGTLFGSGAFASGTTATAAIALGAGGSGAGVTNLGGNGAPGIVIIERMTP